MMNSVFFTVASLASAQLLYDNAAWLPGRFVAELGIVTEANGSLLVERANATAIGAVTVDFNATVRQRITVSSELFMSASFETSGRTTGLSLLFSNSEIDLSTGLPRGPQRFFATIAAVNGSHWRAMSQRYTSSWTSAPIAVARPLQVAVMHLQALASTDNIGFAVGPAAPTQLPGTLTTAAIPFADIFRFGLVCDQCTLHRLRLGNTLDDVTTGATTTTTQSPSTLIEPSTTTTTLPSATSTSSTTLTTATTTTLGSTVLPAVAPAPSDVALIAGAAGGAAAALLLVAVAVFFICRAKKKPPQPQTNAIYSVGNLN